MACPCRHTALQIAVSLCVLGATVGQAAAQQPTKAQENALRSACRNDFMAHCSKVKPSGPAALPCLQRNAASLSAKCRTAVSAVGGGSAPAGAQPAARPAPAPTHDTNVAFVEAVSGRVVVFARGKPALLENSDIISDRAQLDLQANSQLRICHYRANRLLTLRGPSRALVSADGVTDESGRAVDAAVGTCTPPGVSR
jgi:Cysteine rich repeat